MKASNNDFKKYQHYTAYMGRRAQVTGHSSDTTRSGLVDVNKQLYGLNRNFSYAIYLIIWPIRWLAPLRQF